MMLLDLNSFFIFLFLISILFLAYLSDIKANNFRLKFICILGIIISLLFLLSNECFNGNENEVENILEQEKCVSRIFVQCKTVIFYKEPYQPVVTTCKNILNNKTIYKYVQD
jgi:hypothetical protein